MCLSKWSICFGWYFFIWRLRMKSSISRIKLLLIKISISINVLNYKVFEVVDVRCYFLFTLFIYIMMILVKILLWLSTSPQNTSVWLSQSLSNYEIFITYNPFIDNTFILVPAPLINLFMLQFACFRSNCYDWNL